jgi:hypothetical protein
MSKASLTAALRAKLVALGFIDGAPLTSMCNAHADAIWDDGPGGGGGIGAPLLPLPLLSAVAANTTATPLVVGSLSFDATDYAVTGATVSFELSAVLQSAVVGKLAHVALYNATTMAYLANGQVSTTSASAVAITASPTMSTGIIEAHLWCESGGHAVAHNVSLIVRWS